MLLSLLVCYRRGCLPGSNCNWSRRIERAESVLYGSVNISILNKYENRTRVLPFKGFVVSPPVTSVEYDYISITILCGRALDHVEPQSLSSSSRFIRKFRFLNEEWWFYEVYWTHIILHHCRNINSMLSNT